MKKLFLLVLLSSCGGGGGGSGSSSSSPIIGQWLEQMPNPADNIYLLTGANSFAIQQGSCTITGLYTVDANYLHVTNVTDSPACIPQPSAFDCTFSMASNNQLSIVCPAMSANLTRQ